MFKGYLEFAGTELANVERTEAYVRNLSPRLPITPQGGLGTVHIANGEEEYRSPVLDAAPWSNTMDPTTDAFYGLYPLDIQGIGDSTYAATTTESVGAGGTTNGGRSASRDVKLSGMLVASTELAAEAGLTWLRNALENTECSDQCGGGSLRYFLAEPNVCELAWGQENGVSDSISFGTVTGGPRLYDVRWAAGQVDPTMPSRTVWSGAFAEGTEVVFGAREIDGSVLASDDVLALSRNYALNSTFFSGLTSWTAAQPGTVAGGSGESWVYSGGTDGGGYAQIVSAGDAGNDTVYSTGTYGSGIYSGGSVATFTSDVWATPAGQVTVSVALRGTDSVLLELVNAATGVVVASKMLIPGDDWVRASVTGVTSTSRLRLSTIGSIGVDDVLAEAGAVAHDYFDGGTRRDGYSIRWLGVPYASVSELRYVGDLVTTWGDSNYLPFLQVVTGQVSSLRLTWFYRESFDVEAQLLPYERTLHNVAVSQGPSIIQRVDSTDRGGGYFIQVEVLFTAGNPFSYSLPQSVPTDPLLSLPYTDPTILPSLDDDWLFDPAALVPTAPPSAPAIVADAIDSSITTWQRYYVPIPADTVADWAASVPLLQIDTLASPVRQVRVRFHPNPFGYAPQQVDPASYCADFLVSYLPARTSLMMNGMVQSASATKAGVATVPADSILYGSTGGPMTWPHLSCGIPYVMTLDVPSGGTLDGFDVTLSLCREE